MENKNKVSICDQDLCVNVYGNLARAITIILGFAIVAYGAAQLSKALK
jgi:hypothetical protein